MNMDVWYEPLKEHTIQTLFLPLRDVEAKAICDSGNTNPGESGDTVSPVLSSDSGFASGPVGSGSAVGSASGSGSAWTVPSELRELQGP